MKTQYYLNFPFRPTETSLRAQQQNHRRRHDSTTLNTQIMISCIYKSEIHSGEHSSPDATTQVVNFAYDDPHAIAMNPAVFTPPTIQKALDPTRTLALSAKGSWKCSTCDNSACNVCSSVVAVHDDSRLQVLSVTERFHLTCNNNACVAEARRNRNDDSKKGAGTGFGFRLAFRCAHAPMALCGR